MAPESCAACRAPVEGPAIETCREPVFGADFLLFRCQRCSVVFAKGPEGFPLVEWYQKSSYLYGEVEYSVRQPAERDQRFRWLLSQGFSGDLLDVGCGDGRFLDLAGASGWKGTLSGLDFSPEMVRRSAGGHPIELASLEDYARSHAGAFDVVVLFDVIEHFPVPADAILHLKRLVKPGGILALTTPNAARIRLFGRREDFDFPPNHFTRWTPGALVALAESGGFEPLETLTTPLRPRTFSEQWFYRLFSAAMPWAKRLLFGRAADGRTVSAMYEEGVKGPAVLADRGARRSVEVVLKALFNALCWPVLIAVCLAYDAVSPRRGDMLFLSARRRPN
ncbi:MAG: class I SAM-dependent methyltransferase [Elusimicrobiota bacterium]